MILLIIENKENNIHLEYNNMSCDCIPQILWIRYEDIMPTEILSKAYDEKGESHTHHKHWNRHRIEYRCLNNISYNFSFNIDFSLNMLDKYRVSINNQTENECNIIIKHLIIELQEINGRKFVKLTPIVKEK